MRRSINNGFDCLLASLLLIACLQSTALSQEGGESLINSEHAADVNLDDFVQKIYALFDNGEFDEAGRFIDVRLSAQPEQKRIRSLSALRHAFQKEWKAFFLDVQKTYLLKAVNLKEDEKIRNDLHTWFAVAYDEGIKLAREGKFAEGLYLLENLGKYDYRTDILKVDFIVVSTWQKDYDKAIREYEQLDAQDDQPDYLLKAMVDAYREKQMPEKLLGVYDRYLTAHPDDLNYRKAAFQAALDADDMEKAVEHTEYLLKSDPDNAGYVTQMADILLKRNDPIKALEHLEQLPSTFVSKNYTDIKAVLQGMTDEQLGQAIDHIGRQGKEMALRTPEAVIVISHFSVEGVSLDGFKIFEPGLEAQYDSWPLELQVDFADFYLNHGYEDKAEKYFMALSQKDPGNFGINFALADIFLRKERWEESKGFIAKALKVEPKNVNALFLKGKISDGTGDYWDSVRTYDTILKIDPGNTAALNLKARAQMDMGSSSLITDAPEETAQKLDSVIANRAVGDIAMQHIQWNEPKLALEKIEKIIEKYETEAGGQPPEKALSKEEQEYYLRAKWDRFMALRQDQRMKEVIHEYDLTKRKNLNIPPWVMRAVADAYLYLEEPEKSLQIYEDLVRNDPKSYELRMGLYYNLIELQDFDRASALLNELDSELSKETTERGVIDDNWKKANVAINEGWLLMYQDRLKEAEEYIDRLLKVSPANSGLRTAQAQNHLWRGWPRKSLEEFKLVRTMDERNVSARIGHAMAMNSNMQKREAREELAAVIREFPKNKHALKAQRLMDVEDMTRLTVDGNYVQEFPGEDEYVTRVRLDHPVTHHHTLFGYWYRRETTDIAGNDVTKRTYVGDQWKPDNFWQLTGALSFDDGGGDVGYLTNITVTPNDFLTFGFGYESQIVSIPLRSRASGVSADNYSWSAGYRVSESFDTGLNVSYVDFSDGNENLNLLWTTDTALMTRAHWKTRLGTEFSYSDFSSQDVAYFSPEHVYTFYLIPMVEHTWFRRYERAFVDRLYAGYGQNWQRGFGANNLGFVQYEQDHKFSETKSILFGSRYNLNQYDGEDVNTLNFYTTIRVNF